MHPANTRSVCALMIRSHQGFIPIAEQPEFALSNAPLSKTTEPVSLLTHRLAETDPGQPPHCREPMCITLISAPSVDLPTCLKHCSSLLDDQWAPVLEVFHFSFVTAFQKPGLIPPGTVVILRESSAHEDDDKQAWMAWRAITGRDDLNLLTLDTPLRSAQDERIHVMSWTDE